MRRLALCLLALAAAVTARAEPPAPSYDAFRLVRLRNLFDPDRRGPRGDAAASTAPRAGGPLPNYLTFTGAMVTNGRKLAFFSGARPEYNRVIGPRDRIADFVVNEVSDGQVELRLGDQKIIVAVGQNVPLTGSSAASQPGLQPPPEAAPAPPVATSAGAAPAPSAGGADEVLRRMMERRQKEIAK